MLMHVYASNTLTSPQRACPPTRVMGAKREKQAETTAAIRGHFLFNVIYKQLLSLAFFDNHIQKHLYCTNEERMRNNKAIEEEERVGEG